MVASNTEALKGEQTLKSLLELLAQLESSKHKDEVIKEIRGKVEAYTSKELDTFADEHATTGYLYQTIKKSTELRKGILKSERNYKHYTESFQNSNPDQCVKHLIDNIFPLFGCLYYMYYECATECNGIKGGEWYDERCDGMGRYQYLNEWLRDETGGTKHMIQRGFKQEELSEKTGNALFGDSGSQALLDYLQGAQLQFCLYYMLFLPKNWNRGQSGHAVLFVEAFCEKASENKFNSQYTNGSISMDTIKSSCETLKGKISAITKSALIVPVACYQEVQYKNLLDWNHFWSHVNWLKENLENLITSLTDMANDVPNWTETNLMTSKSFGPYPWGFTFSINWEKKKAQLNTPLQNLITAMTSFKDTLTSISEVKST